MNRSSEDVFKTDPIPWVRQNRGRTIRINVTNMDASVRADNLLLCLIQVCKVPPSIKCRLHYGTIRNLCPLSCQRLPSWHRRIVHLSTLLLWVLAGSWRGKLTYSEHKDVPVGWQEEEYYFPLEVKMNTNFITVWSKSKSHSFLLV